MVNGLLIHVLVYTVLYSACQKAYGVYNNIFCIKRILERLQYRSYSSLFVLNNSHLCTALQGDLLKDVFCKEEGLQYCILQRL